MPSFSRSFQARPENPTVEIAAALVRKAIVAYGGESNIVSFKNATFQYQVETPGDPTSKPIQVKTYFKDATFFRSEVSGGGSDAVTILNRDKGWVKVGDTILSLTKKNLDPLKTAMISQLRPDLLLLSFQKFRYAGKGEEEGRQLELVDISGFVGGEYIRGRLSFDSKTNLIHKYAFEIERELPGGKGIVEGEEKYVRYLEAEGLKVPAEITSRQSRKVWRITMNQVDFSTELNPSLFEDPTPAPLPVRNESATGSVIDLPEVHPLKQRLSESPTAQALFAFSVVLLFSLALSPSAGSKNIIVQSVLLQVFLVLAVPLGASGLARACEAGRVSSATNFGQKLALVRCSHVLQSLPAG